MLVFGMPVAAHTFLILISRESIWRTNLFVVVSAIWFLSAVAGIAGGHQFTYWHQGDLLCEQGCNSVIVFSYVVLAEILMTVCTPAIYSNISPGWRIVLVLTTITILFSITLTSCALIVSM
jgi:hypothetical protein